MQKQLTCIICPRGCALSVTLDGDAVSVMGHGCKRGEQYGINECIRPTRTVTSTVRVGNRGNALLSVKTAVPVLKADIGAIMRSIRNATAIAPVHIGDVILADVCGADIVATANME